MFLLLMDGILLFFVKGMYNTNQGNNSSNIDCSISYLQYGLRYVSGMVPGIPTTTIQNDITKSMYESINLDVRKLDDITDLR